MNTHGLALISWPVVFRPLHDALIEDLLARAEASLHKELRVLRWSLWVRLLRWILSGGKARPQRAPNNALHTDTPQPARRSANALDGAADVDYSSPLRQ